MPSPLADQVLVTEGAETAFSVVAPLRRLPCGRTLYKLFSVEPLGHLLPDMFADHVKVPASVNCRSQALPQSKLSTKSYLN